MGRKDGEQEHSSAPRLSKLPLTTAALRQHIMRAHLQTAYWKAAAQNLTPSMDPINFGLESAAATDTLLKPTMLPSGTLLALKLFYTLSVVLVSLYAQACADADSATDRSVRQSST